MGKPSMICPRCTGLVVELIEQDEDGDYCECVKCCNCGYREYPLRVGKQQIEVMKGQVYS